MSKFNFNPSRRGECFICGKSTKLNIHQACGLEAEKRHSETMLANRVSVSSDLAYRRARAKKNYLSGGLPGLSSKDLEV